MITIRKLQTLKPGTRKRKIINLLYEFEQQGVGGRIPYFKELLELLSVEDFNQEVISPRISDLLLSLSDETSLKRKINNLRNLLMGEMGVSLADWDFDEAVSYGETSIIPLKNRTHRLYLEDIRSPFNVGSIFRTAESFGVGHIYLSPYCVSPDHPRAKRASMGCCDQIPFSVLSLEDLSLMAKNGEAVFALELGGDSLDSYDFPLCGILVLGSEELGVSPEALEIARSSGGLLSIPMYGRKGSLNVSVAAGIALQSWISHSVLKNQGL